MPTMIVLLRGVNVGSSRKLPMAELRAACEAEGFGRVRSYIQSGNLLFDSEEPPARVEARIEGVIERLNGLRTTAIARTAADWAGYAAANPFPAVTPKMLHLGLAKHKPEPGAAAALQARATHGEQVKLVGDGLWIDFIDGVADSKLGPAVIDRAVGSVVTMRNLNTVLKLAEMAAA